MKYLFINSVAGFGSTGRIAAETCRELMRQGNQCVLAFGRFESYCPDVPTVKIGSAWDCRAHALRARLLDDMGFGSRRATKKFLAWVREYDPDVIWLHNIHGYYLHIGELFAYLRRCGKPIYWTLHDCWAFTGHCAYFDFVGCGRWKTGCHDCPQKKEYPQSLWLDRSGPNYGAKKALFTGIPNMTLILPSHWLKNRAAESFLGAYPMEVRYNQVDREVFKPTPGPFRRDHGLENKKIVLGVASVWDRRKGLEDFCALAQTLPEAYKIVLIGLTPAQIQSLPPNILGLPRTTNPGELAQAYTAADVYVNPSVEETFGMTVLEANHCGTKSVVYRDTACEEVVDAFGGLAVPRGAEHLREAILKLTKETG